MADLSLILQDESAQARFWAKVDRRGDNECWPWTASLNEFGYGKFAFRRYRTVASRVALAFATDKVPGPRVFALHSCDNPRCCNPAHLRWGTHKENCQDMWERGRGFRPDANDRMGEGNPNVRLTRAKALEIEKLKGTASQQSVANAFGIGQATVSEIWRGRHWACAATEVEI